VRVYPFAAEASDADVVGHQLADPEDLYAPVRTTYAGDLVPRRRRRRHTVEVLGDVVGGQGHRRTIDGLFNPAGGGIAARRVG
jgi:hypothetical protein